MSLKISYYFENTDKFPLEGFFDDIEQPCEILSKAKTFLKSFLAGDRTENRGMLLSENVHFYGSYFIDEGTKVYNDVTIMGPRLHRQKL